MFSVFGFGVRQGDAWFVVERTGCESDEDVAFDRGWEDTEQGIIDVFADQAVCSPEAPYVRNAGLSWIRVLT